MRKLKLYLDTSVISNVDAPHVPVEEAVTKAFFGFVQGQLDEYEMVISPVGVSEIDNCPEPKHSQLVTIIDQYNVLQLPFNQEALDLAEKYVNDGVLSPKHIRDLTHIAYAVVSRCDYIVSWNMKHFVKARTISRVHAVNSLNNYCSPFIVTPVVILGDKSHEDD